MNIESELSSLMGDTRRKVARALTEGLEFNEIKTKYGVDIDRLREWISSDEAFIKELEALVTEQELVITMGLRYGALLATETLKDALLENTFLEREKLDAIKTALSIYIGRKKEDDKAQLQKGDSKSKGTKATIDELRQTILGI